MFPVVFSRPVAGVFLGLNGADWLFVVLASAIILGIIGPKLWRDIQGWRR